MRIEQMMTKDVACCRPEDALNRAAQIMWERDCGFVPIVENGESQRVVGVVTDRDTCMAAYTRGQRLSEIQVKDVMSAAIHSCRPEDDLATAEAKMSEAQVHRLPVVDDAGQLLGVISLGDIANLAARASGSKNPRVTTARVGETLATIRRPRQIAIASE